MRTFIENPANVDPTKNLFKKRKVTLNSDLKISQLLFGGKLIFFQLGGKMIFGEFSDGGLRGLKSNYLGSSFC